MKDLKHYFISPKGDIKNAESNIITNNSSSCREAVAHKLNAVKDITSSGTVTGHSKKKKRKRIESGDFDEKSADIENVSSSAKENKVYETKKKTNVLKRSNKKNLPEVLTDSVVEVSCSTPQLSKKKKLAESDSIKKSKTRRKSDRNPKTEEENTSLLDHSFKEDNLISNVNSKDSRSEKKVVLKSERSKRDSNSSKENSVCSEGEDKELSTPDNNKSLLNYFSKVDKLPEIEERPRIIKVEAMVHVPSSGGSAKSTPKALRKRKSSKKKDLKIDYDLITLEGTESMEIDESVESLHKLSQVEGLFIVIIEKLLILTIIIF